MSADRSIGCAAQSQEAVKSSCGVLLLRECIDGLGKGLFLVLSSVCKIKAVDCAGNLYTEDASGGALPLTWRPRVRPRKFGAVLPGDVTTCRQVRARCALTRSLL